ncbi:MAG: hypothetical protein SVC26_02480 [Pseudomonadota bacterium]|nr:hypothetical protein [Pseudomonadota bacterium]
MRKPPYSIIYKSFDACDLLAETASQVFDSVRNELTERGEWTESRSRIADRLARETAMYESEYASVELQGAVKSGPNGGDVFSMEWSALEKRRNQILKLEEALKLTVQKQAEGKKESPKPTAADSYLQRA